MEDEKRWLIPELLNRDRHGASILPLTILAKRGGVLGSQGTAIVDETVGRSLCRDVAFLSSADWLQSPRTVLAHKSSFLQATSEVRKWGVLGLKEIERSEKSVYGRYANAMNNVELWTNYRFPTPSSSRTKLSLNIEDSGSDTGLNNNAGFLSN
ncbi:hypothetical protein N7494_013297 [Penicillium frequentans]|uniref:Uncharacterized protein n=1 Tax=Penicillium frequentans TaxID=3151616 RepID=A0AAD6G814_9EURO|nr:hypothetical protein N7494_013297 [Penicillium glabrum]